MRHTAMIVTHVCFAASALIAAYVAVNVRYDHQTKHLELYGPKGLQGEYKPSEIHYLAMDAIRP